MSSAFTFLLAAFSLALCATSALPAQSLVRAERNPPPRKIQVNGLWINYVDVGSGAPVILVHGSISDYREWSNQIAALARHYRVIAYSRSRDSESARA